MLDDKKQEILIKKLLRRRFLLKLPGSLQHEFIRQTKKQQLTVLPIAYPFGFFAFCLIAIMLFDLSSSTLSKPSFYVFIAILSHNLIGSILIFVPGIRVNTVTYLCIYMLPVMTIVLIIGLTTEDLTEQIKIFFFVGLYFIGFYALVRVVDIIIWCLASGVVTIFLTYLLDILLNWYLFHLYFSFGNLVGMLISFHNESLQKYTFLNYKLREYNRIRSNTDALTQIANRQYFDQKYLKIFEQMQEKRKPLSVIFIDIDHYKLYNDQYGHLAGDICLVKVANVLSETVESEGNDNAFLARYGGEEFIIVLADTSTKQTIQLADAIKAAINKENIEHCSSLTAKKLTLSMGIAICDKSYYEQELGSSDVIQRADNELYKAKKLGRNRWNMAHYIN